MSILKGQSHLRWTKINPCKNPLKVHFANFLYCITMWHKHKDISLKVFISLKINMFKGHRVRHVRKISTWIILLLECYELLKNNWFLYQTKIHNLIFSYHLIQKKLIMFFFIILLNSNEVLNNFKILPLT